MAYRDAWLLFFGKAFGLIGARMSAFFSVSERDVVRFSSNPRGAGLPGYHI